MVGGVTRQVVRDWVLRFNAHGPRGLVDRKAPGATAKLNAVQRRAPAARFWRPGSGGPVLAARFWRNGWNSGRSRRSTGWFGGA